jgi:hypothetical protein
LELLPKIVLLLIFRVPLLEMAPPTVRAVFWLSVLLRKSRLPLAAVALALDEPEQAAKLLGATSAVSEDHHTPLSADTRNRMTPLIEVVRAAVGEVRYAAAWAHGRSLTLEQIVDQALEHVS